MMSPEDGMRVALREATLAGEAGEVPVGAALFAPDGQVIALGRNTREADANPLGHAELSCLHRAAQAQRRWRLDDLTLYVTLEPCPMCAGAIVNARIPTVVYGCADPKAGAMGSLYRIGEDGLLNHSVAVKAGVLEDECRELLQSFFKSLRASGKNGRRNV
jgi:tRNA(adenine34) deaminase